MSDITNYFIQEILEYIYSYTLKAVSFVGRHPAQYTHIYEIQGSRPTSSANTFSGALPNHFLGQSVCVWLLDNPVKVEVFTLSQ